MHDDDGDAFSAYLHAAQQDQEAASGLALAYAALPLGARRELVAAIERDAAAEGLEAAPLLAGLLGVEHDLEAARHIARAMLLSADRRMQPRRACCAFHSGDEHAGGIALVRSSEAGAAELLWAAFTRERGITTLELLQLASAEAATSALATRCPTARFEPVPVGFAIDSLAPLLWQYRRGHGALPPALLGFADLFDIGFADTRRSIPLRTRPG